jgi:hypothetical protein
MPVRGVQIRAADSAPVHLDPDLAGSRLRLRGLGHLELGVLADHGSHPDQAYDARAPIGSSRGDRAMRGVDCRGYDRPMAVVDEREARLKWFQQACERLHGRYAGLTEGEPAAYIPELAEVDPDLFAIAAVTVDDRHVDVGDSGHRFTIQSISKLLVYGLALETHGRDRVLARVGVAPTG